METRSSRKRAAPPGPEAREISPDSCLQRGIRESEAAATNAAAAANTAAADDEVAVNDSTAPPSRGRTSRGRATRGYGTSTRGRGQSAKGQSARGQSARERGARGRGARGRGAARRAVQRSEPPREQRGHTREGPAASAASGDREELSSMSALSSAPDFLRSSPPLPRSEREIPEAPLDLQPLRSECENGEEEEEVVRARTAQYLAEFRARLDAKEANKRAKADAREQLQAEQRERREAEQQRRTAAAEAAAQSQINEKLEYLLTTSVHYTGGQRVWMQSSKRENANSKSSRPADAFNFQRFTATEIQKVADWLARKAIRLVRVRCVARIRHGVLPSDLPPGKKASAAMGKDVLREVDDSDDWLEVEAIVALWVKEKRKSVRVDLRVDYAKPRVRDDGVEEVYTSDIEEPAPARPHVPTPSAPVASKGRTTATTLLLDEMAAESTGPCKGEYIGKLLEHYRCQNEACKQYKNGGACLSLKHDSGCRPLNAAVLAAWNEAIVKGDTTYKAYPLHLKLPDLVGGRKTAVAPQVATATTSAGSSIQQYFGSWPGMPFALPKADRTSPPPPTRPQPLHSQLASLSSSAETLEGFFEWYGVRANELEVEQLPAVLEGLKREQCDLETIRCMTMGDWKTLGVPGGLGLRIGRHVSVFLDSIQ